MTVKILASQAPPDFAVLVQRHAADMKHWRGHMERVEADKKNKVAADKAHAPFGRPQAHPLVESAVNERGDPDFEIVNDGPTPGQILAAKKSHLLGLVTSAENEANTAVLPRGKVRLFQMREAGIHAGVASASIVSKIKTAIVGSTLHADDAQFLKDQEARRARLASIARTAAQAHHDIEDLTLENIDAWTMPDFRD